MIKRHQIQLVIVLLLLCFSTHVHAQPAANTIWGVWEGSMENWEFFPDNTFVLYDYDMMGIHDVRGTYQFSGTSLQIWSAELNSLFDNVEVSETRFRIIPAIGNTHSYVKIVPITTAVGPCLTTIQSHLYSGLAGRVSSKGTLNLRSSASTSASILQKLQPGERVAVVNGPTCADGFAWWNVLTLNGNQSGWVAEASDQDGYFVEALPMVTNRTLLPSSSVSTTPSTECGNALPTNLAKGSYVKVAFVTGEWLLEGHKEPQESSEITNVYGAGERLSVEDGPVCANGLLWWKVYSPMNSIEPAWVPEASGSLRLLLRLTQSPSDATGTYDVFSPYGSGQWHLEAQTLMRVYASADNSSVVGYIMPGTAYEVYGRNESSGMYQVSIGGAMRWVCGDGYFIAFDQRPHRVPVTDGSTFNCNWQDHYFDASEELQVIAAATSAEYYPPGQYPQMERFAQVVAKTVSGVGATSDVLMSKASSILSLFVNAVFIRKTIITTGGAAVGSPIEITCTAADLQNLGFKVGDGVGELTPTQSLTCIATDTASVTVEAGVFWGRNYAIAQLFLNSNTLNDFVNEMPLTRTYCKFVNCYGGPGSN